MASTNGLINNNLAVNTLDGLTTVNTSGGTVDPSTYVKYSGNTSDTDLSGYNITTSRAPTGTFDLTNKSYVDTQNNAVANFASANYVPYGTGTAVNAFQDVDLTRGGNYSLKGYTVTATNQVVAPTAQFTAITSATPSLALGVDGSGNLRSFAVPSGSGLLTLNNTWTGTNDFNNAFSAGKNAITATLTATTWNQPYWTAGTGTATYSYNTGTTQGTAYGTIGVSSFTLNSTGLTAGYGQTYQMTITNMVFSTPSSGGVYFEIRQSGTVLYNSGFLSTYTSTTRTFNFAVQANGTSLSIIVYDFAGASSQPYFFFGTITLTALSTTISNPYVSGALQIGSSSYPTPTAIAAYGDMSITGATSITGIITATGIATGTPATTIGLNASNQLIKYANPTSVFTGSVSTGYVPYASSANVLANSLIYQTGSSVGISNTSPTGTFNVGGIVRMGNYTGGNYDNIEFLRGTGTNEYPNIRCQNNYFGLYTSAAGGWCSDSQVGDMVMRPGISFRVGINGASSSLVCHSNSNVGINLATPTYKLDVFGSMRVNNGDASFTTYIPTGGTWNATMNVGSGTNRGTAQVFATNGNLHMDAQPGYDMYYGYYPYAAGNPNPHRWYGGNYNFAGVPQNDTSYSQVVCMNGDSLRRSQAVIREIYSSNGVAWGGGVNISNAFYSYNGSVSVLLTGRYSGYWTSSTTNQVVIRYQSVSTGAYYYKYLNTFTNNTYNHVTVPLSQELYLGGQTGWWNLYIANNSGYQTDGNDQLQLNIVILPVNSF